MGFLAEDLEVVFNAGVFLNLNRKLPVVLGGEFDEKVLPHEGIIIWDDDVGLSEGSDAYGDVIYSQQSCSFSAYVTNRPDRKKLKDDLIKIIEDDLEHAYIEGYTPIDFEGKHGIQMIIKRIE